MIMRNINLIVTYVIVSIYRRDNQLFISIIATLFFNECYPVSIHFNQLVHLL